ncbi:MAG: hypothetical protein Q9227_006444 [Pyrenula ochraceoflavens]
MADSQFASIWQDAGDRYIQLTGKSLKDLPMPQTVEDLKKSVEWQNEQFKHFREKKVSQSNATGSQMRLIAVKQKIFSALNQALDPIESIGNMASGAATAVYQPAQQVFGAAMQLVTAARNVSAELDAVVDLLEMLKDFTVRLAVYKREDLSSELRTKLKDVLIIVMEVFARSLKKISDGTLGRIKAFTKNALVHKDNAMQGLLERLSKLTLAEDRLVSAETLVEGRQTARAVKSVQTSVDGNTAQLSQISHSMNRTSAGVDQVLDSFEDLREESRSSLLKKTLEPSPSAHDRLDEIQRQHIPNSGDWIRAEEPLQSWIASKTKFLWVSGHPGSGKSFLTYSIITYLRELHQQPGNTMPRSSLGFFFFRNGDQQMRSFEQALRDVAYQIAQTNPAFAKHIAKVVEDHPVPASLRSIWYRLFKEYFLRGDLAEKPTFVLLDGVDEALAEDRLTFLGLLRDLKTAGSNTKLHVCMIGRPEIGQEISNHLDFSACSIYVDPTKNGKDVQRFVERSIENSRVLNRVSESLKQEIFETLYAKAEAMFLWVRLMIAELSKKSRESAIREALHKAPKGLNDMLRHVLEGFSATLTEEDADDLNNMLACVALAKRPLTLGELNAMLRLRSANGDGVIYLEGKLRKQFASFFVLTREDNLTTANLQNRRGYLEANDFVHWVSEADEGMSDVENETNFNSNPDTTTISFTHDSLFHFFRDRTEGTVTAPGDNHPAVGVDLAEAQREVAKACINMIVRPTKENDRLLPYAKDYWNEHLADVQPNLFELSDKIAIGKALANMLQDSALMEVWCGAKSHAYFKPKDAEVLLLWLNDQDVLNASSWITFFWIQAMRWNPIELFEPTMRFHAKKWLTPVFNTTWNESNLMRTIFHYRKRKTGHVVDGLPKPSAEDVIATAEWFILWKNSDWYRHVGRVLEDFGHLKAASEYYSKAQKLDPSNINVSTDISKMYVGQRKFKEALELDAAVVKRAENDNTFTIGNAIFNRMAGCYEKLAYDIGTNGNLEEKNSLLSSALDNYKKAFSHGKSNFYWVQGAVKILHRLCNHEETLRSKDQVDGKQTEPGHSAMREPYKDIIDVLRSLDDSTVDDTTQLVKCLLEKRNADDTFWRVISLAAVEQQQLPWLEGKYKEALAHAEKHMHTVASAQLAIALGWLYAFRAGEESRAMQIWEAVAKAKIQPTAVTNAQTTPQLAALNNIGHYCLFKAVGEDQLAEPHVAKMEKLFSKYCTNTNGDSMLVETSLPRFLATWYHQNGRHEDALGIVKPYIIEGLAILSDDDPENDFQGYGYLADTLLAIGDYSNVFSIFHAMRPYRNGQAVIKSDSEPTFVSDEYDLGMVPVEEWSCVGNCGATGKIYDGLYMCPYDDSLLCEQCHMRLIDGKSLPNICSKRHGLIQIPILSPEQAFKKGEMLVDGQTMSFEDWKASLRTKYNA